MQRQLPSPIRWLAIVLGTGTLFGNAGLAQPVITLRDFTLLPAPVAGYDEEGIRLQNGEVICWSRIVSAAVKPADQARVDGWMRTIGRPLAKLKWRLEVGDFSGAHQAAEELSVEIREGAGHAALWSRLANMAAKIEQGESQSAALDWINAQMLLADHSRWLNEIPASLMLPGDPRTMLHPQIMPTWNSTSESEKVWPTVQRFIEKHELPSIPVSGLIYLAAITIEARQFDRAETMISAISNESKPWAQALRWKLLMASERAHPDVAARISEIEKWPAEPRAVATLWLAMPGLSSANRSEFESAAVLALSVPANYQRQFPELSAVALLEVAQRAAALGDDETAEKLYNELRRNYSGTHVVRSLPALQ